LVARAPERVKLTGESAAIVLATAKVRPKILRRKIDFAASLRVRSCGIHVAE
jgi:hypothetical protein